MKSCEAWRAECEARWLLAKRQLNRASALEYLELVAKRRGQAASEALRDAASALWTDKQKGTK